MDARPRTSRITGLHSLPDELVCMIARELNDHDLVACELVTTSWNATFKRPVLVQDRIARGFPVLLHHADTQRISYDEMRKLYHEACRARVLRRRGKFHASMAEYPLRADQTNFTSDVLPSHGRTGVMKRDQITGKIFPHPCFPCVRNTQYYGGCIAWRLTDQYTIIDHLDTMHREVIEWPGHQEFATWNKENYTPNHTCELSLKGLSEDLLAFYDERPLPSQEFGQMVVYHRGLKQWRSVNIRTNVSSWETRFFTSTSTIVYRTKEPGPRTLLRWDWEDGAETGFQFLASEETWRIPNLSNSTLSHQLGPVFNPIAPGVIFTVTITVARGKTFSGSKGRLRARAVKHVGDVPTATIEFTARIFPLNANFTHRGCAKYPFGPCNGEGENVVAIINHETRSAAYNEPRLLVTTLFFNAVTERFSCTTSNTTHSTWADVPDDHFDMKVAPFVWERKLHYNMPVHVDLEHQYPKVGASPVGFSGTERHTRSVEAFVRFLDAAPKVTGGGGGYLPIPSPEHWDADTQCYPRMVGDSRYLILLQLEAYVVWCFDEQRDVSQDGWRSWDEEQTLIAAVRKQVEHPQSFRRPILWDAAHEEQREALAVGYLESESSSEESVL